MVDFPADLIIDILSRLPVTSVVRFRSISKSCQSLIDSHYFQTLHLNKFRKSKSSLILEDYSKLYAVDFPTLSTAVNFNQPLNSKWSNTILGSCNGLLCIKNANGVVAIWSPSLRKHWILPPAINLSMLSYSNYGFGFGFDPLTGDYKLVTISCPYSTCVGSAYESRLNLFSCRTNAWKTLLIIPFALRGFQIGVFVDHALHWVVVNVNHKLPGPNLIVAFDLRFEVFNEVPLPELGEGFEIDVSHLGKCLSIVVNQSTEIDIWVMKQYGCKDSWFKLFTLVKPFEFKFVKPLGYYSEDDGMKVLLKEKGYSNKLCWYNLKSKQVSLVTIPGIYKFSDPIIWVESIVQPPFPSEAAKAAAAGGVGMHI